MKKRDRLQAIEGGKPSARHRARTTPKKRGGAPRASHTVRDVMVSDVVTIDPAASLAVAARTMEQANVGMLPVIEDGRVRGLITDRDIVVRAVARDADAAVTQVGECLTRDVIFAHPEWTTEQAMQTMSNAQVGRLPVVDDQDRIVGVVTLSSMAFRARNKSEALKTAEEISRRSARAAS